MTYTSTQQDDYARRLKTGEFYTPPYLAKDSAAWLLECLTLDAKEYVFYDPAAGAGNLLEALPEGVERYGSTLETQDIPILKNKGINAFQFDFLEGKISDLPPRIMEASDAGRLVVFTNPPYFKVPADKYQRRKKQYGTNDSAALFLKIIIEELQPICVGFWSKIDIYQSQQVFSKMLNTYMERELRHLRYPIMCNSKRFSCKGEYPILFSVWSEWHDDTIIDGLRLTLYPKYREMLDCPFYYPYRDTMQYAPMVDYVATATYFDIYPPDRNPRPVSEWGYHY